MNDEPAKHPLLPQKESSRTNDFDSQASAETSVGRSPGNSIAGQYLLLAERSVDIMLFLRASDARILEANRAAESAYGYSREELLQKTLYDLRAKETWPELTNLLKRIVKEGAFHFEGMHRRSDGSFFPIEASWSCIEQGSEHVILSIVRDITLRRKAEDQLRLITDAVPALISYIGADYRYRFVNHTYTEWFGHSNEDIIGRTMSEVLGQAAFEKLRPHVDRAMAGKTEVFETETPYKDGGTRFIRATYSPDRANDGTIAGFFVLVLDISESKRIEKELLASKEFLKRITDIAPTILYVYDLGEARNVWVNRDIMNILGYSPREVEEMGDNLMPRLMHPDDLERYSDYYRNLLHLRPDETSEFEYRMRHRNGSWVWLYSREMAFAFAPDGSVSQIVGAALDITERKRIYEALNETAGLLSRERERLDIALRTGALGVYEWQIGNVVIWWSPELYPLYGVDPETFTPTVEAFNRLIHPEDREEFWRKSEEAINQARVFTHEYRIIRPDGAIRWIFNRSNVGLGPAGQIERITGVAADITERKELQSHLESMVRERTRELQQANLLLETSNKELEQFAFVTSHDLQEPLRKIQTFSDLLLNKNRDLLDSTSTGYLNKIINSSNRMRNLVEDLLRFSRLSQPTEEIGPVDLSAALQQVLETYDMRIEETGAVIITDPLPVVPGVAWQLHLMLANLVGNSLKFVKPGVSPRVHIGSRLLSDREIRQHGLNANRPYVEVFVADNGIGFEQEHAERIFAIFQRLHGISEYQGTGIGLAICNKVALAHHGKIFATSVPGDGATFFVVLPVHEQ